MLTDNNGKKIDYLRISVIDRCNLNCRYCGSGGEFVRKRGSRILSFEQITHVCRAASELGIRDFRLTGGEPLRRKDICLLVKMLKSIPGASTAMTTNGQFLSEVADDLRRSGLDRINISIDSQDEKKYRFITGGGSLSKTQAGIEAAVRSGLEPVKLNVVVIKGFNVDELKEFASLTIGRKVHVRFIELMSTNAAIEKYRVSGLAVKSLLEREFGSLEPAFVQGKGPSRNYALPGALGTVGFIEPHNSRFCMGCNRLRLTANGYLMPCLYGREGIDVKPFLNSPDELKRAFHEAVRMKPAAGCWEKTLIPDMGWIGG